MLLNFFFLCTASLIIYHEARESEQNFHSSSSQSGEQHAQLCPQLTRDGISLGRMWENLQLRLEMLWGRHEAKGTEGPGSWRLNFCRNLAAERMLVTLTTTTTVSYMQTRKHSGCFLFLLITRRNARADERSIIGAKVEWVGAGFIYDFNFFAPSPLRLQVSATHIKKIALTFSRAKQPGWEGAKDEHAVMGAEKVRFKVCGLWWDGNMYTRTHINKAKA